MNDSRSGYGSLHMPRSRGAVSGLLLIALGVWGALIPFIGPYLHFAYTPDQVWVWNTARGWLEVLPGVVTAVGGVLLLGSGHRATAVLGGWLAVLGGAWFVVGRTLAPALRFGDIGQPIASTDAKRAAIDLAYFYGLGALIVFLGGAALARVTIRTARDVEWAHQANLAPTTDAVDEYDAPAAAQTEVLPPLSQEHRPEKKRGLFRRRGARV